LHTLTSSFVLGYHGCDKKVAEKLLDGDDFKPSQNDYDWLGSGIYFWETNPKRGLEFAEELKKRKRSPQIKTPAVVGAVIDMGLCLDLTSSLGVQQVRDAHKELIEISKTAKLQLPKNTQDLMRRKLDCAVIQLVHRIREEAGDPPIDSIKGIFIEGSPIYQDSGFHEKTHIQICVCNPERIKGVFRVPNRFLA